MIGIIEGEQGSKKEKVRNDRVVAVEQANHSFADVDHIRQLGKKFVRELEAFFINYHALSGNAYAVLDVKGPARARKRIEDGISRLSKTSLRTGGVEMRDERALGDN